MISSGPRSGYLVVPEGLTAEGAAPGVLLLHSWWGLSSFFKRAADRLADAGFVTLVPDLHLGHHAETPDEAEALLAEMDPNVVADLVVASASVLRSMPVTFDAPIGVVGFSMGASWGLWLAARQPELVGAMSAWYGSQAIDLVDARAAFQLHVAEHDELVDDDELALMEATLRMDGREVEAHHYAGTAHWFAEDDRVPAYDEAAATLGWERTLAFLHAHLDAPPA